MLLVHWQSCIFFLLPCTCFWWLLCQGVSSPHILMLLSSIIREHNVQLKSEQCQCLNLGLLPESVTSVLVLEFVNLREFHLCLKAEEFYFVTAKNLDSGMLDAFAMITFWRPVTEVSLMQVGKSQLFIYQQIKLCLLWLVEHHIQEEESSHGCSRCSWSTHCLSLDPNQKKLFSLKSFGLGICETLLK